jgi:tripartite-type tricarboxylate transporter receptor subunit TctC
MNPFSSVLRLTVAVALAAASALAAAQTWPTKPVRIVVPFPPGQSADIMMRLLAERLTPALGKQVIVDNRAGAGGAIGMEHAAKSEPDGHTVVMGASGPTTISPTLQPKLPYDPLKDFEPVTAVASVAQVFMANPSFPAKSIKELIALAKSKPGDLNYGSSGVGTTQHLFVEAFASAAGIKLTHVAYKGSSPAVTDLLGGQIPMISDTVPVALPLVRSGKVRPLAVTSIRRQPFLPDVPTIDEQGIKGFNAIGWIGVLAPAGTPPAILDRLSAEMQKAIAHPETKAKMDEMGFVAMSETREKFRDFMRAETAKWRKVIADANVKVD